MTRRRLRPGSALVVLDQVAYDALAVADRASRARSILGQLESRATCARVKPLSWRSRGDRLAVQLLGSSARALHARTARRRGRGGGCPALVGERAVEGLADPPGRVGRELVPTCSRTSRPRGSGRGCPPGSGRAAGRRLRVAARDRHHEAEVRTRSASAWRPRRRGPCAGRARAPPTASAAAVAELADVELERVSAAGASPRSIALSMVLVLGGSSSAGTSSSCGCSSLERRSIGKRSGPSPISATEPQAT